MTSPSVSDLSAELDELRIGIDRAYDTLAKRRDMFFEFCDFCENLATRAKSGAFGEPKDIDIAKLRAMLTDRLAGLTTTPQLLNYMVEYHIFCERYQIMQDQK